MMINKNEVKINVDPYTIEGCVYKIIFGNEQEEGKY